ERLVPGRAPRRPCARRTSATPPAVAAPSPTRTPARPAQYVGSVERPTRRNPCRRRRCRNAPVPSWAHPPSSRPHPLPHPLPTLEKIRVPDPHGDRALFVHGPHPAIPGAHGPALLAIGVLALCLCGLLGLSGLPGSGVLGRLVTGFRGPAGLFGGSGLLYLGGLLRLLLGGSGRRRSRGGQRLDQLDDGHRGVVTLARTDLGDARVTTGAVLVARADHGEQLVHHGLVRDLGQDLTAGVQVTAFAQGDQLLRVGAQALGLGLRGTNATVGEQRGGEVRQQVPLVSGPGTQTGALGRRGHGVVLLVVRSTATLGREPVGDEGQYCSVSTKDRPSSSERKESAAEPGSNPGEA